MRKSSQRGFYMKKPIVLLLFSIFFASQTAWCSDVTEKKSVSPQHALLILLDGNRSFAQNGSVRHLEKMASIERRTEIANAQHPLAVIIACSDSRVPPELLFDKGLGEIFVVRVAGNIVGPLELGSVEYAVEHLGAKLVMVLGHERCGAVTATYDAYVSRSKIEGYIGSIVESINPAVKAALAHGAKGTNAEIIDNVLEKIFAWLPNSSNHNRRLSRKKFIAALSSWSKLIMTWIMATSAL